MTDSSTNGVSRIGAASTVISAEYVLGGAPKRVFDIVFAAQALVLTLPLLLTIYAAIRILSPGPALFIHKRVGLNGKTFGCIKFRTMHVNSQRVLEGYLRSNAEAAEEFGRDRKLKDDPRIISGIGTFLRKTSLDELPQFINVLLGEMSVVGPRPVTQSEIDEQYGARACEVLSARPGITGLWQVSGRNEVSYDERVKLDLRYLRTWSFWQDLRIVFLTVNVLLLRRGAY